MRASRSRPCWWWARARGHRTGLSASARQTNPRLDAEEGLINFSNVHSCGPETAVSVPCMFSNLGRADYSDAARAPRKAFSMCCSAQACGSCGRTTSPAARGTCDRVAFQDLSESKDPALCDGECHDEILLRDLQAFIDGLQQDTVLVLHQMGSHGPAYFKRYPREYESHPGLRQQRLQRLLAGQHHQRLRQHPAVHRPRAGQPDRPAAQNEERIDTGMLYLSDHGESLPASTTSTCMARLTCWRRTSRSTSACWPGSRPATRAPSASTVAACASAATRRLSQDNLFHSMLGLLEVRTGAYDPGLDLFASAVRPRSCRRSRPTADGRCTPRKRLARSRRLS
ncbi:hypothetical protein P4056_24405 [Pseudomonas aeruginosa]|nr:hypothetical protein [Pseudomonas aeruginosa]